HHSHTTFPSKTMALRLGTTLRGSKYSFRLVEKLGDNTVFSPVFKAEILPGVQSPFPKNRWAAVKSADLENQTQVDCLVKEYKYYKKPSIESSRSFRKLYDIINDPIGWTAQKPFCLAFKWMDTTLAEVPFEEHMKDPVLVANIVKVYLEAFVELENEHLVYSNLKPANVLISSVDGLSKVKIGDLGLARPDGSNPRWVQPEAFRAPEVWTGVSCFHKADVWSIAAMILQRVDPNILGNADNIDKKLIHPMAWCLAKIILLFDPSCSSIPPPSVADKSLQAYFKLAQNLITTQAKEDSDELLFQIPSFEVWADLAMDAGIPKAVLDVIRLLAVPDPTNRPSARQALQSPEYKALQKSAATYGTWDALLKSSIR
ncbi:Cyclin-dependent kinase 20, partial [Lachnellula arida]